MVRARYHFTDLAVDVPSDEDGLEWDESGEADFIGEEALIDASIGPAKKQQVIGAIQEHAVRVSRGNLVDAHFKGHLHWDGLLAITPQGKLIVTAHGEDLA